MSAAKVIQTLEKIIRLYKSLNGLASKKIEVIKSAAIQELNILVTEEKKHMQAIQKFEKILMEDTKVFLMGNGSMTDSLTITDCIKHVSVEDKKILERIKVELEDQVSTLKQKNDLNQQLLEQSLQFVNLSLDMLLPAIDSFNYERPNQAQDMSEDKRSIFDSKA